ncbi:MAG: hypothetical protein JW772_01315 [Candidatus Diapherotrites archaeon]|nr:hypothetical protein [Candidatus Diapherotrites archaeon]
MKAHLYFEKIKIPSIVLFLFYLLDLVLIAFVASSTQNIQAVFLASKFLFALYLIWAFVIVFWVGYSSSKEIGSVPKTAVIVSALSIILAGFLARIVSALFYILFYIPVMSSISPEIIDYLVGPTIDLNMVFLPVFLLSGLSYDIGIGFIFGAFGAYLANFRKKRNVRGFFARA